MKTIAMTYTIDNTGFYADELMTDGAILTVDREVPAVKLAKVNDGIRYTAQIKSADDVRAGKTAWAKATATTAAAAKAAAKAMYESEDAKNCPF